MEARSAMKWALLLGLTTTSVVGCGQEEDRAGSNNAGVDAGVVGSPVGADGGVAADGGVELDGGVTADAGHEVSFSGDVLPLLASCSGYCHPGNYSPMGLGPHEAWANLVNAPSAGCDDRRLRVTPGDPDPKRSYLMAKLLGVDMCSGGVMPGGGMPAEDIEVIRRWIAAGAQND